YNKSIYLINGDRHFDNGFMLLKEDIRFTSPLATVFFEEYEQLDPVRAQLEAQADKIQCIVTEATIETGIPTFPLGGSQCPALTDYADGVDVLKFLSEKNDNFVRMYVIKVKGVAKIPDYVQLRDEAFTLLAYF